MDRAWWNKYIAEAREGFAGEFVSCSAVRGVNRIQFNHGANSGAGAIALAEYFNAPRIILVGYDCQKTGGKVHWHGDHPKGLGNAKSLPKWRGQFKKLADRLTNVEIYNASRETALPFWPRVELEDALAW